MFRAFTGLMVVGALALSAASAQAHDYDHVVRYGGDWDHRHWEHERAEHERLEQLRRQQAWREREYLEHHTYRPTLEYGVQYAPQYVPQYVPQYETFARPSCEHAATAVVVPQPIYQPGVGFSLTGRNFSLSVGR